MTCINPIWVEYQRRHWLRHDWRAWVKPEAHHLYEPPDEKKRTLRFDEAADVATVAEQDAFERELLALRHELAKLKLDHELRRLQRKYSPDQPRVPAGSREGGGGRMSGEAARPFKDPS